ncbi:acyltransferase [Candidatus Nanopelagicales bacterium]|nr:acyltransferase [Candidatus Nanopelagicales bacterium]
MSVFIRQLTGIRFVAAFWVFAYHLQGPFNVLGLLSIPVLGDVMRVGRLGVDLFFALSGFILTHTYLTRMGPKLRGGDTVRFWWLRLARIYPVHLVMLIVAGLAVFAQARVLGEDIDRDWWNPIDFVKNLLLIQEWGPNPERGWNFVAWSLSMEWLAYLAFPLLVLVLWRMHKKIPTFVLVIAWFAVLAPLVGYGLGTSDPYYTDNWGSTYRIASEFTAGAITYLIVQRLARREDRVQRPAEWLSAVLPVLVVAGAVFLAWLPAAQPPANAVNPDAEPLPPYFHLSLVPLLVAWIGALALARGGMARALSTKTLVLGGFISYSLYMTHLVWMGLWRAGMSVAGIDGGVLYALGVAILIGGALIIAWIMWRVVEEPAREWMRGLVGTRRTPTEEAGEEIVDQEPKQEGSDEPIDPVVVPDDDQR